MVFGIAAPVLVGVAGIAVDYARYNTTVANLQGLADGAAVAAVRSMAVANMTESAAAASVDSYVKQKAEEIAWQKGIENISVTTRISSTGDAVEVTLSQEWAPMLAHVLTGDVKTPVVISSTAKMIGTGKACVIGLDQTSNNTIYMDDASQVVGDGCGVFSNSSHANSIVIDKDARLEASVICSAGGALVKKKGNVNPDVTEDCPALENPLADRAKPSVGSCTYNSHVVGGTGTTVLSPGVYCGGLTLKDEAAVSLNPGVYIIKDGPLMVQDHASVSGSGVGFYLTGSNANFTFTQESTVSLEAPQSGPLAGLLFFEDDANAASTHTISSSRAETLLGTIYLPKSTLQIDAEASVAGASAYTAFVVNKLLVREGPVVTLNSDYDATNVPVPPGLIGGKVILTN
jgi:Flp pilus assembly protein TadG